MSRSAPSERELAQIDAANASGQQPVLFVHGLWMLASSWDVWRELFASKGFATIAPEWPGDAANVAEGRANPTQFAGTSITDVTDHLADVIGRLRRTPVVVGHSFGGLFTQQLAGRGLSAASVAIDAAPFRGVLPLPPSVLRSGLPVLQNPANRNRAVMLTYEQFRYAFANAVDENEARRLYERFPVPGAGRPLFEAAFANLNPRTAAVVDTSAPNRGPLLLISGERDHIVPWSVTNASFKRQRRNPGVTQVQRIDGRGHSLVFDSGWEQVALAALEFVTRHGAEG